MIEILKIELIFVLIMRLIYLYLSFKVKKKGKNLL